MAHHTQAEVLHVIASAGSTVTLPTPPTRALAG
jgi:hypothetical protein